MMSGESSAIAAPNQGTTSAFAEALERAKAIAKKINPAVAGSAGSNETLKRSAEDTSDRPETKKVATGAINSEVIGVGGNINSSSNVSGGTTAAQIAAAQAAAVAAKVAAAGIPGGGLPAVPLGGPVATKEIKVPDRMVGLIIGRGGEQISRLQAESGCKIQMAPDSGGQPDRLCSLTGNQQAITRAEELIYQIVQSRAREIVGSSYVPPSTVNTGGGGGGGMPCAGPKINDVSNSVQGNQPVNASGSNFTQMEIMIPGPKVGLIIGKGGETIKMLQEKSGAKMIIIQDGPGQQDLDKPLRLSGEPQKVEHAKALVFELMAEKDAQLARRAGRPGGPPGMGGGGGGGGGGGYPMMRGGGPPDNSRWEPDQVETTIAVPAGKCGVIIGKGGETIRQINQQTGAHCEIERNPKPNATEKIFHVRGTLDQIENVKRLFSEKLNMNVANGPISGPMNGAPYGMNAGPNAVGPGYGGGAGGWGGAPQPYQQSWPNQPTQPQGHPGAGGGQVQINPLTGQPDYSAQWIEYYRSLGMHREAAMVEEQAKASKMGISGQMQPQQFQQVAAIPGQAVGGPQPQPAASGQQQQQQQQQQQSGEQGGQVDYSAQWAAYYRSIGKIKDAEAIEMQMKAKQSAAQSAPGQAQPTPGAQQQPAAAAYGQPTQPMYCMGSAAAYPGGNPAAAAAGYYGAQQQPSSNATQQGAGPQYGYPGYPASASSESH